MKYSLIFFLVILFFIPSTGICQVIFSYDFNKETTGKPPSAPWSITPAGKIEIVDFPSKTNKSVKITDSGSGAGMTLLLDSPIKNKTVSLEFNFMRENGWTVACEIFYVMNKKCPDDWSGICIKDSDNGFISYHNGVDWVDAVKLTDDQWHTIKLIFYLEKDKYDFYYDGKEMAKNVGYRKWDGLDKQGIDKFNVANVGDGGSTFVKYYDDIILYEGTTKPFAVKSDGKLANMWGAVKISASESQFREYPNGHKGTRFEKGLLSKKIW